MLFLTIDSDNEEDHGFRIHVSSDAEPGSIPVDLTDWGAGSSDIALAMYNNPGAADGVLAIISAVAQTAFNMGKLHQQKESGVDLIGVG